MPPEAPKHPAAGRRQIGKQDAKVCRRQSGKAGATVATAAAEVAAVKAPLERECSLGALQQAPEEDLLSALRAHRSPGPVVAGTNIEVISQAGSEEDLFAAFAGGKMQPTTRAHLYCVAWALCSLGSIKT